MPFSLDKTNILGRADKSPKGSIDIPIAPLLDAINAHDHYATTSSCSGRIVLLHTNAHFDKSHTSWLYVSHDPVTHTLWPLLSDARSDVWFRYEGAILHLKSANLDAAHTFVQLARSCGFKRTGIISTHDYPTIELTSSEFINAPLRLNNSLIADEHYLAALTASANHMLARNHTKLTALTHAMQSLHTLPPTPPSPHQSSKTETKSRE